MERPKLRSHIPALDGVRGLAILLVIIFHAADAFRHLPGWSELGRGVALFLNLGWSGVDLFFVLSGFLITGILLDNRRSKRYFRSFYVRRILRIFPIYFVFLFGAFFIYPLLIKQPSEEYVWTQQNQLWYWTYLQNFLSYQSDHLIAPSLHHFWSLAVEEQFYIVWPLLVYLLPTKLFGGLCVLIVAGAPFLRSALLVAGYSPHFVYVCLLSRMDALAIGALLALWARSKRGWQLICYWAPIVFGISLFGVVQLFLLDGGFRPKSEAGQVVGYSLYILSYSALLILALGTKADSIREKMFAGTFLRTVGKYSYAMYIFHSPINDLLFSLGFNIWLAKLCGVNLVAQLVYSLILFVLSFLVAWISWNALEKHFLKMKRFVPY